MNKNNMIKIVMLLAITTFVSAGSFGPKLVTFTDGERSIELNISRLATQEVISRALLDADFMNEGDRLMYRINDGVSTLSWMPELLNSGDVVRFGVAEPLMVDCLETVLDNIQSVDDIWNDHFDIDDLGEHVRCFFDECFDESGVSEDRRGTFWFYLCRFLSYEIYKNFGRDVALDNY
jgi:hypothetical protein